MTTLLRLLACVAVAVVSGLGARFVVLPLNDGGAWFLGWSYVTAAVLLIPWVENTWLLIVADVARRLIHRSLGPLLVAATLGFAVQERLLLSSTFPQSLPLWFGVRFWTFGPLALLAGAGIFLLFRHFGRPMDGYLAWILWHGLWNYYWLVLA